MVHLGLKLGEGSQPTISSPLQFHSYTVWNLLGLQKHIFSKKITNVNITIKYI